MRNAGEGNRIAVVIGGSGLVGEAAAILEADIFRTGNIRSNVVHEDRICLSGMGQGSLLKEGKGAVGDMIPGRRTSASKRD